MSKKKSDFTTPFGSWAKVTYLHR